MKQKRDKVYIWVTWLTGLISGDKQCEYASWFKAHHQYDKKPSDFNLTVWNIKHNQLVHKCRDELEEKDYTVTLEDQNPFKLVLPEGITISGKPDIIAIEKMFAEHEADETHSVYLIADCKTGRPKNSDLVQVMLYMIFIPECIEKYKDVRFDGEVVYTNDKVPISQTEIDSDLKKVVWDLIKRVGDDKPCRKVPSYSECRWCDISKENCPERIE